MVDILYIIRMRYSIVHYQVKIHFLEDFAIMFMPINLKYITKNKSSKNIMVFLGVHIIFSHYKRMVI